MRRVALLVATAGGAGYAPFAPGTVGSAVGVAIYFLIRPLSDAGEVGVLVAISLLGVWASAQAARYFDKEDPGYVVIDEVAGQLATFLLLDVGVLGAIWGFLLFRALDIVKPWPAGRFESLPRGWGIMADDLMAGAYGWLLLWGTLRLVAVLG